MITVKRVTFSKETAKKISEIEKDLIPIYLSVWGWNFVPKTYEDRVRYTKELIVADYALILKDDDKSIGYLAYKYKTIDGLTYLDIIEIDILSEYQGKGYSHLLREKLFEEVQPDVLYGEAQNPISVRSRDRVMKEKGFYTYWAQEPVDKLYPVNKKVLELSKKVVEIFDPNNLPTYVNGIKQFTLFTNLPKDQTNVIPELRPIYEKVKKVSENNYESAFGVLISVRKEIIDNGV